MPRSGRSQIGRLPCVTACSFPLQGAEAQARRQGLAVRTRKAALSNLQVRALAGRFRNIFLVRPQNLRAQLLQRLRESLSGSGSV